MIPKIIYEQLVRKIGESVKRGLRWQLNAILALRTASEDYLNKVMKKSFSAADHAKGRTTQAKYVDLVRQISKK